MDALLLPMYVIHFLNIILLYNFKVDSLVKAWLGL